VWKAPEHSQRLWFEFTDDYSVFDWGKMPDTIANKGRALAVIGTYLFQRIGEASFWRDLPNSPHLKRFDQAWLKARFSHSIYSGQNGLRDNGAPHHFTKLVKEDGSEAPLAFGGTSKDPVFMEVFEAAVHRPTLEKIMHQTLFVYPQLNDLSKTRLIPLEIVFRFGMPSGSSLTERLAKTPEYAQELGVEIPGPGKFFAHPVLEFYTKLEPKDRLLSWQEAVVLSGLSGQPFEDLIELALDTALALYVIFAERKIELWDGKVEMVAQDSHPILADSIGPDELRLLYEDCHLSKEMIRQVYRGTQWETQLKEAQKIAKADNSRSWKEVAVNDLKIAPEPLTPAAKQVIDQLYGVLANHLVGEQIFEKHPPLDRFIKELPPEFKGEKKFVAAAQRKEGKS